MRGTHLKRKFTYNEKARVATSYICTSLSARVHNKRRDGEYPTSTVWPNALHKVMI